MSADQPRFCKQGTDEWTANDNDSGIVVVAGPNLKTSVLPNKFVSKCLYRVFFDSQGILSMIIFVPWVKTNILYKVNMDLKSVSVRLSVCVLK